MGFLGFWKGVKRREGSCKASLGGVTELRRFVYGFTKKAIDIHAA